MEILIAVAVGLWVSFAGLMAYRRLKKDFENLKRR